VTDSSITTHYQERKPSIWPLFAAPIAAIIFYGGLNGAFLNSLEYVVGQPAEIGEVILSRQDRKWGTHWVYRVIAEGASLAYGTFIAAGIARERARAGGIIGGLAISAVYAIMFGLMWYYDVTTGEPWYQDVLSILLVLSAPLIGFLVSETAEEISTSAPAGFAGIPRAHFLWLWIISYLYALGLIAPIAHIMTTAGEVGFVYLLQAIPVLVLAVPLYYGLQLLAGTLAINWHVAIRQLVGSIVLVGGLAIGMAIQVGLAFLASGGSH